MARIESGGPKGLRLPFPELTTALIFLLVSAASISWSRIGEGLSLVWPSTAIVAALCIRLDEVRWPRAAALLLASGVAMNLVVAHRAWPLSICLMGLNCIEIALTVALFRRALVFPYPKISIDQAAVMTALFGIAIPGLTACGAAIALHVYQAEPVQLGLMQWWSSHAMGACLFGPPIILYGADSWQRLIARRFRAQNFLTMLVIIAGCFLAIRYVRFPFVPIAVLLLVSAFRVGGFGASLLGAVTGITIATLWSFGLRPAGLEPAGSAVPSLETLPVLALLATTMPAVAVGLGTDARRATARRLHASERRFRESMAHSPIGMLIAHLDGTWEFTNLALQRMLGYTEEEFRALPPGGPSDSAEWDASEVRWQRLLRGELESYEIERRFRHKDGRWVWTHVAVSLLRDENGSPQYLIGQIENLEARRQAESRLTEERERLRITLAAISEAVITTDVQTRVTYMNAAAESLLGLSRADSQGRLVGEFLHLIDPQTSKTAPNLLGQCAVHGQALRRQSACTLHRSDGSIAFVADSVSPVFGSAGELAGMVMVFRDVGSEVSRAQDLNHRASHDPLTNLANRFEFHRQLTELHGKARHLEYPAALIALDLDRFKAVNDRGGHAAGDAVLRRVAEVLRGAVRQSDLVARLGGDEFAVVLPGCAEARALGIARQILRGLNPLIIAWDGAEYETGASVGLAMLTDDFETEAQWLAAADHASYQAKKEGRGLLRTALAGPPAVRQQMAARS